MTGGEEDGEAYTLGLLKELRELAKEISHGHMDYAEKFHILLQSACNPNLPTVAQDFGFTVLSSEVETGARGRTIAVCANITVAIAAWECACKIFPNDRWLLTWDGMVQYDSRREKQPRALVLSCTDTKPNRLPHRPR